MAGVLRATCRLFANGQKCVECPTRGMASCPLPDVEDLFLAPAPPRPPQPVCRRLHTPSRGRPQAPSAPPVSAAGGLHGSGRGGGLAPPALAAGRPDRQASPGRIRRFSHGSHVQQTLLQRGAARRAGMSTLAMTRSTTSAHVPIILTIFRKDDVGTGNRAAEEAREAERAELMEMVKERMEERQAAEPELSSEEGKQIFLEALRAGETEGYFGLAQHGVTQADPKMEPLSALSVVLNALSHDPGTTWKGPWRWNSEELMLCGAGPCGHTPELLSRGMTLAEFTALARCKGVRAQRHEAAGGVELFRKHLAEVCGDAEASRHLVVSRGGGKFTPVGGYSSARDMVLVLDVARHERPARWVSVERLWEGMQPEGGYVVLSTWSSADDGSTAALCPSVLRSWSEHGPVSDTCCPGRKGHRHGPRRAEGKGSRAGTLAPGALGEVAVSMTVRAAGASQRALSTRRAAAVV